MKGLKFLLGVIVWLCFFALLIMAVYYRDGQVLLHELNQGTSATLSLLDRLRNYFTYADGWNYLRLVLFLSFLLILFAVNEILLKKRFSSKNKSDKQKSKGRKKSATTQSHWKSGIYWLVRIAAATILVFIECVIIFNLIIIINALPDTYHKPEDVPAKSTILLLGTNKKLRHADGENLYYTYRIDAVNELYKAGKISRIIISGDNGSASYNEPADMRQDLLKKGIPSGIIKLDYAGFRTLDSIIRLREHFRVNKAVVVSQRFHTDRSLFLADYYGLEAIAYPAKGSMTKAMFVRELLAKPKVFLDIFIFNMQPKYGRTASRENIDFHNQEHVLQLIYTALALTIAILIVRNSLNF